MMVLAVTSAASVANAQDEAALQKRVNGLARMVSMDGYQISPKGITCEIRVSKPLKNPARTKNAPPYLWVQEDKMDAVLRGVKDPQVGDYGGLTIAVWKGKAWRIGWVQFATRQGVWRKLPLYTASEEEALAFYRTHGFTQAAKDAVRREQ
jgi:hypothetical protein